MIQQEQDALYAHFLSQFGAEKQSFDAMISQALHSVKQAKVLRFEPQVRRDKDIPGNVTPEYYARIKKSGGAIETTSIENDRGVRSGKKHKKVLSPVDVMRNRGHISEEEWLAANDFMTFYYLSGQIPSITVRYELSIPSANDDLDPMERRKYYYDKFCKSVNAVDRKFSCPLAWILQNLIEPISIEKVGAFYSPGAGIAKLKTIGMFALRMALWDLCQHYDIEHDLDRRSLNEMFDRSLV